MTRRLPPKEDPENEPLPDDLESKLAQLRTLRQTLRQTIDPNGGTISVCSPTFIIFYAISSMVIIAGLVFHLKGYF
jgi:hypothetical protein